MCGIMAVTQKLSALTAEAAITGKTMPVQEEPACASNYESLKLYTDFKCGQTVSDDSRRAACLVTADARSHARMYYKR